ncbi:MAG: RNA-binding protein [Methylococcaceae bacterium]|nr:RNA-binding protein [Methylococcaceae bacterium]
MADLDSIRIDKWLWTARFFKTRRQAADAVSGGKVHINGQRCKPSREVKQGTLISITKEPYHWKLIVLAINSHRRPAKEAILLYQEDAESINKRQQQIILEKEKRTLINHSEREIKPNKKQRRQIHRFKGE